jgi:hypothetical protein
MACSLNKISSLQMDVLSASSHVRKQPRPLSALVALSWRRVSASQLSVMEIPMLGLMVLILAISALVRPDLGIRGTGITLPVAFFCPFYALTDIPCLLCGMTRSFLAMGGFQLGEAFRFHPLGPIVFLLTVSSALALSWSVFRKRRIMFHIERQMRASLVRFGAALLVSAWVLKLFVWKKTGLI